MHDVYMNPQGTEWFLLMCDEKIMCMLIRLKATKTALLTFVIIYAYKT